MSKYLGNSITDSPTEPSGQYDTDSASGVWSLTDALIYTKKLLWPTGGNIYVAPSVDYLIVGGGGGGGHDAGAGGGAGVVAELVHIAVVAITTCLRHTAIGAISSLLREFLLRRDGSMLFGFFAAAARLVASAWHRPFLRFDKLVKVFALHF